MGAPFVLDHVFVFARPGGPEASALAALGLTDGEGKTHLGQGTANRCFFFQSAFLELIWVHDEQEARSAAIARTGLWEHSQYRQTGACPFGICLRAAEPENSAPPFETWGDRPPHVPTGSEIPVAVAASFAERSRATRSWRAAVSPSLVKDVRRLRRRRGSVRSRSSRHPKSGTRRRSSGPPAYRSA
ncbi:VOC family protein [Labilithrix luteola]|uniref:VOC family protein n=1 Tax=Labilithrix luteola TaxID=1391654 RepID=UPI0011BACED7